MLRPLAALLLNAGAAAAQTPQVMTDIAPVHSLVARVMEGVADPGLLLPPGASPHDFALRPSDAGRLADADLVVWAGDDLTPWLEEPITALATGAEVLELLETEGWPALPLTDGDGTDPHAWLDPFVAGVWLGHIAEALAGADPASADRYRANAAAGQEELAALLAQVTETLASVQDAPYIVPHDAYGYFERRFAMPAAGTITLSDAQSPGPAHLRELRARIEDDGIACVLTDPQVNPDWSDLVREGSQARTAQVDALGVGLTPGPDLYPDLIRALARGLADCLGD